MCAITPYHIEQEELKRMTRSLQIFKMRRDALSGGTCIHDRPQTKLQMAHSNTDIATKMFCRSVAEEIVQAALKRFDNRPEIAAVQKYAQSILALVSFKSV